MGASLGLTGRKRTRMPGVNSAGGSRSGSQSTADVRPSRRHPPGDVVGYTAASPPATATEPAGTRSRGSSRRGTAARPWSIPVRYPKPGEKPIQPTVYSAAACLAITSPGLSPVSRATSARSGPS